MTLALFAMHWPCSKLSWEMKQELRKGQGAQWGLLFNLSLPGTTLRYAWGAIAVPGLAQYDANVLSVGNLSRGAADRAGGIEAVEEDFEIDDTGGAFAGALYGAQGHLVRGSAITQVLGSPNVPRAQWFTVAAGVIDAYQMVSRNRWKLTLRPNDLPLRKSVPKVGIFQADWPNADQAVYAQYGPLLYGKHDSSLTTKKGAIPLVYVDTTIFRYLVCWGRAKSVDGVYVDGVKQVSGFTTSYQDIGGRTCTVVTFTSDQGTKVITADAQGYETVGDGTGPLIETPTDVIRHWLTNWVYNDFKGAGGAPRWFASSAAPIDQTTWDLAAVVFARSVSKCARRLFGEQRLGYAVFNEWCESWQPRTFWTNAGLIGCRAEDNAPLALYRDEIAGWIRSDRVPFDPTLTPDWESLNDRINVNYHFQEAAGKALYSMELRDPALNFEAPDTLDLQWSAASLA